jgi:ATP-binding cassette subfamily B protein
MVTKGRADGGFATRVRFMAEIVAMDYRADRLRTVAMLALIAVEAGCYILFGLGLQSFFDSLPDPGVAGMVWSAAAVGATYAVIMVSGHLRANVIPNLNEQTGIAIDRRILEATAKRAQIDHLEDSEHATAIDEVEGNGAWLANSPWTGLGLLVLTCQIVTIVVLMVSIHPLLCMVLPFAALPVLLQIRGEERVRRARESVGEERRLTERLFDLHLGPRTAPELKVSGAEAALPDLYSRAERRVEAVQGRAELAAVLMTYVGWLAFLLAYLGGLGFVYYLITTGEQSLGGFLMVVTLMSYVQGQFQSILGSLRQSQQEFRLFHHYQRVVAVAAAASTADAVPPSHLRNGITMSGVSFAYPGTERAVLREVDLFLPAGTVVAVVGEYGAGKSTLVKLLCGLYRPTAGSVLVDGVDLQRFPADEWRRRITAAFQDHSRYEVRAGEAVWLGDVASAYDLERVEGAAAHTGAAAVADGLPSGWDTRLGREFGDVELSDGQWQKFSLARATMRDLPVLVVLDEPTASLDLPSERQLFRSQLRLARELGARTGAITIIVTHRFGVVPEVDHVIELSDGRVVDRAVGEERDRIDTIANA